jgi:hypothetical protein
MDEKEQLNAVHGREAGILPARSKRIRNTGREHDVPRLFAPREIVLLEQLLRELREKMASTAIPVSSQEIAVTVLHHREQLPELHAFVRGMIYGL